VEVCPETELIAIEASATVCDDAFQIGEGLEVLVGERLIQNRPEVLIPTRVKADSFRAFQTGASQIPWRRTGGSPCGQELRFARTMTRPSFGHWRKRAGTRVKVGGCWRWPRSMMAAPRPKRLGSGASGCRRFGTGLCGSTLAGLRA